MTGRVVDVKTIGFTYGVLIEENALASLGKMMRHLFSATKVLLISDTKVYTLYGEQCRQSLVTEHWEVTVALVRPGERSKTLAGAGRLYDAAVESHLDRSSPVVALGGGVVGDLAGFVAATYMRGVPLVMVPTSLLAQVDSSVGGKVAVNHHRGKNLIGSFYPPRLVIIDPMVLKTLPARQLRAGLAEVIKYGIIESESFFCWLEENIEQLLQGNHLVLAEAVERSVQSKAKVVEEDEFEKDYRRALNFGHTLGHGLEAATGYRYYLHGEAVLIGMIAAVEIAAALMLLDAVSAKRIQSLLKQVGVKPPPKGLTSEVVISKLMHDKKRRDKENIFILPVSLGSAVFLPVNDEKLIHGVIRSYLDMEKPFNRFWEGGSGNDNSGTGSGKRQGKDVNSKS
ncbi:MAG TPA: 3-dehydroquinate synthase [Candidatus Limnocylindrales bacterium]|nr:3-dehydroquinate synthase [Candidatus Limnocylindrales bacterium]